MDINRVSDIIGMLKVSTCVLGLLNVALMANSYMPSYILEDCFLVVIVICLIASFIFVGLTLVHIIPNDIKGRKMTLAFHFCVGLILFAASVMMCIQVHLHRPMKLDESGKEIQDTSKYAERITVLIIEFLNVVVYGSICFAKIKLLAR